MNSSVYVCVCVCARERVRACVHVHYTFVLRTQKHSHDDIEEHDRRDKDVAHEEKGHRGVRVPVTKHAAGDTRGP